ncbi:MAG: hypothetical protein AB1758_23535 [Candidatus Eremiobacterota bacterium]
MRKCLIFLALGALLLAPALAQKSTCAFCHHDGSQSPLVELPYVDQPRMVCERCVQRLPHCTVCDLPTDKKQHRDGRYLCASCLKTGVSSQAQAEKLYKDIVRFVDGLLGANVKPLPPVRLCDVDELQTRHMEGGRAIQVAGFYQAYNPEQIYLMSYEMPIRCGATLAHEYTHAWQSRHSVQQDRALKEGFASWVEYHYLVSQHRTDLAESLRRCPDPDYGASLNKLLEIERSKGRAEVLKLGRTGTKLP